MSKENDQALKEIAGRILQMSNRALEKMADQEGPIGEAATAELERREARGEVREMDDLELDAAARGEDPQLAELANQEVVRRREGKARERAETATAGMVEGAIAIDERIAELLEERAELFREALEARYGTGLPLHDGRATNAIAAAFDEAFNLEGLDGIVIRSLAQGFNGLCRRWAEGQLEA